MAPTGGGPSQFRTGDWLCGRLSSEHAETVVALQPNLTGAFLRGSTGLSWCPARHPFWVACEVRDEGPSLLQAGDEVRVHCAAGRLAGSLKDTPGASLALELIHGAELQIPREQIQRLFLVHRTHDPQPHCAFTARSKSGNRYAGTITQVLPDGRALVKLRSGAAADLHMEKLDLDTLELLLEVPIGSTVAALPIAALDPPAEGDAAEEGEELEAALERERSSSQRLKRILDEVMQDRQSLEEQVLESRRALESEVWRGMARNKELTSELRELKKQLGSDEPELPNESSDE